MSYSRENEKLENVLPQLCRYDLGQLTVYHFVNEPEHRKQIIKEGFKPGFQWQGVNFSYIPNLVTGGSSDLLLIVNVILRKAFDLASASREESLALAQYMNRKKSKSNTLEEFFRSEGFDSYIGESGGAYFTSSRDQRELVVLDLKTIKKIREPSADEIKKLLLGDLLDI
jgi:hypothetical protein